MNTAKIKAFFWDNWLLLVIIAAIAVVIFFAGEAIGDRWASARFHKEREAALKKADEQTAKADEWQKKAQVAEGQNKILRDQNEKQAELLKKADDAEITKGVEKLDEIAAEREEKLHEIATSSDEVQKCKMCQEAREQGVEFNMCKGVCDD